LVRQSGAVNSGILGFIVLSSLVLIPFGLDAPHHPLAFLHIPTVAGQFIFTLGVFLNPKCRDQLISLSSAQLIFLATLFAYVLWVSFTSPIPSASFLGQFWLIHIMFFVALVCFFRSGEFVADHMIWLLLGLAALVHVMAFLVAWAIWPDRVQAAAFPAFENIRFLGYFLAPAAAAAAVLFVTRTDYRILTFLSFAAAAFYLIHTGSRGGTIAVIAGLSVSAGYMMFTSQRAATGRVFILAAAVGLLFVISAMLPILPWPPLFERAAATSELSGTQALSSRDLLWGDLVQTIKERWMFGYGAAYVSHVFGYALDPSEIQYANPDIRNAHNIFLQLLMNWGVVGCIIIVLTALAFARNIWCAVFRWPNKALLPFGVLTTMMIHSLVSGVFFYPYSTVIGIIAFARLESIGWRGQNTP